MADNAVMQLFMIAGGIYVPTFICAALLRANGVRGLLAIVGLIAIASYLFSDLEGWQLGVGTIGALLGLAMGGALSDRLEYRRLERRDDAEKARRRREKGVV